MRAKIVGVTGSVGKTTCKEIIYYILSKKYKVLRSKKSFNTEFGLLLTILHQESGFSSAAEWLKILFKSLVRAFFVRDRYDFVILEMGVDKPGDMDFLTEVAPPDIAVMTAIKRSHLNPDQFSAVEDAFKEKKKIFLNMAKGGEALINIDDEHIVRLADSKEDKIPGHIKTYSELSDADFTAINAEQTEYGIEFDLKHADETHRFGSKLFGAYQVSSLLPAIAIGILTHIPIKEIQKAVSRFALPPGRMSLLEGKKDTLILDSSYNASPDAVKEALKTLDFFGKLNQKRRIFVFGNMNELGAKTKEYHEEIGELIPKYADILITVGDDARFAADRAIKAGLPASLVFSFDSPFDAAKKYMEIIKPEDVILIKGSQNNVRLEFFAKEIMAHPEIAKELLVRQDRNWESVNLSSN